MAFSAPGSGGFQGSKTWYQQVAIEIGQFITTLGTIVSATITNLTIGTKIVFGEFQITQGTDPESGPGNKALNIQSTTSTFNTTLGILGAVGTTGAQNINLYNDNDTANSGVLVISSAGPYHSINADKNGTGSQLPIRITTDGFSNTWIFGTDKSLTLSGNLVNTAIADLAAAAGQLWLSSTNVDNLKYSSATTLYTIHSTKSATNNATAAAPTATASGTAVMMACGGAITPANTGRVLVTISGQMANDTINDGATVQLRYGTGTAPINGAAVTGTLVGIAQTETSLVGGSQSGFAISGIITGLTLGTAIWIDAALNRVTGGNASITGVTISAVEV